MVKKTSLTAGERRNLMQSGFGSMVLGEAGGISASPVWSNLADDRAGANDRILVIVELSGGNDGLNTVIPHADDAYYRARPRLGIRDDKLLRIDDHFGFQKTMAGFERLYKDGEMAIVHGVGYDQPSFSHFSSMAFWQTGAPNSGEAYGWLGRMADAIDPLGHVTNLLVNIDDHQSLAVRSMHHVPLVFDDPAKFTRRMFDSQKAAFGAIDQRGNGSANPAQSFLCDIAASASSSEQLVRDAWSVYSSPVDYGLVPFGLEKVAALIAAEFPTKVYYVPYRTTPSIPTSTRRTCTPGCGPTPPTTSPPSCATWSGSAAATTSSSWPSASSAAAWPKTPAWAPTTAPPVRPSSSASR
jgi:hypothetical protein